MSFTMGNDNLYCTFQDAGVHACKSLCLCRGKLRCIDIAVGLMLGCIEIVCGLIGYFFTIILYSILL